MKFTILPDVRETKPFPSKYALKRGNWDDYGYKTTYELYRNSDVAGEKADLIGTLSILFLGGASENDMSISEDFNTLPSNACSVSSSLDFYARLSELTIEERQEILNALNDLVWHPELRKKFSDEEGYTVSLFRGMRDVADFFVDAKAILSGEFSQLPELSKPFTFKPFGCDTPIKFNFEEPKGSLFGWNPPPSKNENLPVILPRRISVMIGRNGCGKSTLLSRLARVAFASAADRSSKEYLKVGELTPPDLGFTRIITISYSAFDSFNIPGSNEGERLQIAKDIEKGTGRFHFCGLRDIVAEVNHDAEQLNPIKASADRRPASQLKSLTALASEFSSLIDRVKDQDRTDIFRIAVEALLSDASFSDLPEMTPAELLGTDPAKAFLSWSTGHKIVMHILASLCVHCERKAIALFDEPEAHLHPPLIAALMRSVRIILERTNSFCVVATHSPVVLQETLAQHVHIIERTGTSITVRHPKMETFAESIGLLTYDSFGLTAERTYYHRNLEELVASADNIDQINTLFPLGLSGQAEATVMSLFARKTRKKDG